MNQDCVVQVNEVSCLISMMREIQAHSSTTSEVARTTSTHDHHGSFKGQNSQQNHTALDKVEAIIAQDSFQTSLFMFEVFNPRPQP